MPDLQIDMMNKIFPSTPECEIVSTRVFNVSKEMLFSAFSNPEYLKQWWGPKDFTSTFLEFDFREGGRWKFIMHGPGKGNYPNEVEFVKIDRPDTIAWKRYSKPLFNVSFTFKEVKHDQTLLEFRMVFDTEEECNKIKGFAVDKNEENFDRLQKVLAEMK